MGSLLCCSASRTGENEVIEEIRKEVKESCSLYNHRMFEESPLPVQGKRTFRSSSISSKMNISGIMSPSSKPSSPPMLESFTEDLISMSTRHSYSKEVLLTDEYKLKSSSESSSPLESTTTPPIKPLSNVECSTQLKTCQEDNPCAEAESIGSPSISSVFSSSFVTPCECPGSPPAFELSPKSLRPLSYRSLASPVCRIKFRRRVSTGGSNLLRTKEKLSVEFMKISNRKFTKTNKNDGMTTEANRNIFSGTVVKSNRNILGKTITKVHDQKSEDHKNIFSKTVVKSNRNIPSKTVVKKN